MTTLRAYAPVLIVLALIAATALLLVWSGLAPWEVRPMPVEPLVPDSVQGASCIQSSLGC